MLVVVTVCYRGHKAARVAVDASNANVDLGHPAPWHLVDVDLPCSLRCTLSSWMSSRGGRRVGVNVLSRHRKLLEGDFFLLFQTSRIPIVGSILPIRTNEERASDTHVC